MAAKRSALASTDGKVINQHFGRADSFHIVDIGETGYDFIETRASAPSCNNKDHREDRFDHVLTLLADCEIIVVQKIGFSASQYLISRGKRVFEAPGFFIEDVIAELRTALGPELGKEDIS